MIIRKPEDGDSGILEDRITDGVAFFLGSVNSTVDLYCQFRLYAMEINDKSLNDVLAPEVQAVDLIPSRPLPKQPFCAGHIPAHSSGLAIYSIADSLE